MTERYEVIEWGNAWVILDKRYNRLVLTAGDKDDRILQAAILNGREEKSCKTQCKVIAIR